MGEKLGSTQKLVEAKKISLKLELEPSFLSLARLDDRLTTRRHLS
jgi:hypothetical protein